MTAVVIFSDLDGTLLDARTYSFDGAAPALALIGKKGVPLVLCSSKTRAEMEAYRRRLRNLHPFIAENGGGTFIPAGYFPFDPGGREEDGYSVLSQGVPYREIRGRFEELRGRLKAPVRGFGDMTAAEVASLTGLTEDEASRAKQREYDEPFVFAGAPDERFLRAIEEDGLRWTRGRLFHIMGGHDKGKAAAALRGLYERERGPVTVIGLGDGLNDLPLLLAADRPVLVRREDGTYDPDIAVPGLYRTNAIGPAGWNEAVLRELT